MCSSDLVNRASPADVSKESIVDVEHEWLAVRIVGLEFHHRSVGDDFIHDDVRMLRLEPEIAAKRGNEYMGALGLNVQHVLPEQAQVGSLDD